MPTDDIHLPAPVTRRSASVFEPSAALAILDGRVGGGLRVGCGLDRLPRRQPALGRDGASGVRPR